MDQIVAFVTQPLMILLIAVFVFVGRVVYLAKRLKSASRRPLLADTRALEEATKALGSHRESLDAARATVAQNLGGARDTLRDYKRPLESSIETRREGLRISMENREAQKKDFEALRSQKAYKDAKKLVRNSVPRTNRRSPKDI